MSKNYYCAACGRELVVFRKAIPKKAIVLDLVEPHECDPKRIVDDYEFLPEEKEIKADTNVVVEVTLPEKKSALDFSFVQKLNKASDTDPAPMTKDQRSKDYIRKELTSSAPAGLLQRAGLGGSSEDANLDRELEEPEDGRED